MNTGLKQISVMAIAGFLLLPTVSMSAEPEDLIKYRRSVMKAIGGHMSAISLIVRGKVPYKAQLKSHAEALKALSQDIPSLFPEDSDFGETRAKQLIWEKKDEFNRVANAARESVENFLKTIEVGKDSDILESFNKVGESCKGCHKDFRQKDD